MEYAPGGNLHDFIKRQPSSLPEAQVWRLFLQVRFGGGCPCCPAARTARHAVCWPSWCPLQMLVGLNYMHQRKVLHRDFKTLNVFLDEHCNVRLGDLGVAKVRGSQLSTIWHPRACVAARPDTPDTTMLAAACVRESCRC
jgi:NIMA (never in mitosis gene a)-related kinase